MERRRHPRFLIEKPVYLKVAGDEQGHDIEGITRNASANGVFLFADSVIPVGSEIDVTFELDKDLRVHCEGKVLRVILQRTKIGMAIACHPGFGSL